MDQTLHVSSTAIPPHGAAPVLDEAVHAQLSRSSMGLPPISLILGCMDWLRHLAVSRWRSVYKIHSPTHTQITSILESGQHHAGIGSKPVHPRRSYRMHLVPKGHGWIKPDDGLTQAPLFRGSWCPALQAWLKERSGTPVPVRAMNADRVLGLPLVTM